MPSETLDLLKVVTAGEYELARKALIDYVRQHAEAKGITHRAIAEGVGMKRPSVSRILSNKFPPTLDTLLRITRFLNLDVIIKPLPPVLPLSPTKPAPTTHHESPAAVRHFTKKMR